jgi:uncharacterized protein YyaL (SSP411 family)
MTIVTTGATSAARVTSMAAMLLGVLVGCAAPVAATRGPEASAVVGEVVWQPWSKASFERARTEQRLILVNVVATWCHWCHVMEETTYRDPEVAALLRDHFTTIRVDSDARPDVAERYREWGWPATGVLSPDAQPVLELRGYQEPRGFAARLRQLVADRDRGSLRHREADDPAPPREQRALDAIRVQVAAQLDGYYEPAQGGWGKQQRYPAPGPIEHAFVRARIDDDPASAAQALTTLASAAKLIDPVFGGMYQYSVGGDWDHPHFEKITAIQAGAIRNFAWAHRLTGDARWLTHARDVARYMTTMMRSDDGGFYTSQDADLRREGAPAVLGAEYYAVPSAAGRRALGIPRIDTEVYADLNGMMIEALCDLHAASGDREPLEQAEVTAQRLLETHADPGGGFRHRAVDPEARLYLRDQVAMGRGLLALHRTTGDPAWLAHAERVAAFMLASLRDPESGAFFVHTVDPDAVGVFARRRTPYEENGLAARLLAALHRATDGDGTIPTPYLAAAERALESLGDPARVADEGRIIGQFALGLQEVTMPTLDVTVVGKLAAPDTRALLAAALRYPEPRAVVEVGRPGDRYPAIGKAAVYLCTATACSTPITRPERFAAAADAFLRTSLPPRAPAPL